MTKHSSREPWLTAMKYQGKEMLSSHPRLEHHKFAVEEVVRGINNLCRHAIGDEIANVRSRT
jgi:hypothetical protein